MKIKNNLLTKIRSLLPIWSCLFLLSACQDYSPVLNYPVKLEINTQNYGDLFEYVWEGLDKNYVFWDIDPTDWDKVYKEYLPQFQALSTKQKNGKIDTAKLKNARELFEKSMSSLIDGHLSLSGLDGWTFSPLKKKRQQENTLSLPNNYFDSKEGIEKYLDSIDSANVYTPHPTENISKMLLAKIKEDTKIIYFTFRSFYLKSTYKNNNYYDTKNMLDRFFNMIQKPSSYKGLILDLRNNNGGSVEDIDFFVSRFVQKTYIASYSRTKAGPNRYDYSPWMPLTLFPYPNSRVPKFPIVILVNTNSVSLAETTALMLSYQPNVIIIGDTTYGAFGPVCSNSDSVQDSPKNVNWNFFTVGQKPLSITVHGAIANTKSFDHKIYEGKGFPPKERIELSIDSKTNKIKDTQLKRAIKIIQEKSFWTYNTP